MRYDGPVKRIFFALWPKTSIRDRLHRCRIEVCPSRGRWVPRENLHVTLNFIGNVEVRQIPLIESVMSGINTDSFELQMDCVKQAPAKGMVWLVPSRVPDQLELLVTALQSHLAELNFKTESRRYQPHVTLLRKLPYPFETRQIDPIPWPTRSFALVESAPGDQGRIYSVLKNQPIGR